MSSTVKNLHKAYESTEREGGALIGLYADRDGDLCSIGLGDGRIMALMLASFLNDNPELIKPVLAIHLSGRKITSPKR